MSQEPFDPSRPAIPISYPIESLDDLASRSYFQSFHYPFNRASVPLSPPPSANDNSVRLPQRPRMLLCHDMKGGYLDDRWIQGGSNPGAYAIWHWSLIDVFVYFSHHLVTLPPPCWTNAAHTHGVKVLGTFIAEFDGGVEVCKSLLSTKSATCVYAERLAELASALGFDGWLINMEVTLGLEQITNLKEFVDHLTQSMHSLVPGSLVIWYDAVTKDGQLIWQNQLNEKNKPFFDLCDGIFMNYTWKENYPQLSGDFAGDRRFDVYMGIDVFGRNTYGGGQWNIDIALDLLKREKVSAAIFAPGWVIETLQKPDFETAQNRWWGLIEKSWGTLRTYPKELPFYCDFDRGYGFHYSIGALQVAGKPWNNISSQGFQPVFNFHDEDESPRVFISTEGTSYGGGGSVTVRGKIPSDALFISKLFEGEVYVGDSALHVSYSIRTEGSSVLGLSIVFSSETRPISLIFTNVPSSYRAVLPSAETFKIIETSSSTISKKSTGTPWLLCEASVDMEGLALTDIGLVCAAADKEPCRASLGHISIRGSDRPTVFPTAGEWIAGTENVAWNAWSVSLKVTWMLRGENDYFSEMKFVKYGIYVEKLCEGGGDGGGDLEFLGISRVEAYYVSDLQVPEGAVGFRFIIQPFGPDGSFQELDEAPSMVLEAVKI